MYRRGAESLRKSPPGVVLSVEKQGGKGVPQLAKGSSNTSTEHIRHRLVGCLGVVDIRHGAACWALVRFSAGPLKIQTDDTPVCSSDENHSPENELSPKRRPALSPSADCEIQCITLRGTCEPWLGASFEGGCEYEASASSAGRKIPSMRLA
jgi:hypothetical protein